MPKATCPACKTEVKYPRDAEKGTTVTCPECEEVFTPPKLVKKEKKYDPKKEETYGVKKTKTDAHEKDKSEAAAAAMRGARERARQFYEPSHHKRGWFEGPEIWLLIFAIGAGGGIPFGLWLARSWDKLGDIKMLWIIVAMVAVMMIALGLGGSAWAWLRKNR